MRHAWSSIPLSCCCYGFCPCRKIDSGSERAVEVGSPPLHLAGPPYTSGSLRHQAQQTSLLRPALRGGGGVGGRPWAGPRMGDTTPTGREGHQSCHGPGGGTPVGRMGGAHYGLAAGKPIGHPRGVQGMVAESSQGVESRVPGRSGKIALYHTMSVPCYWANYRTICVNPVCRMVLVFLTQFQTSLLHT